MPGSTNSEEGAGLSLLMAHLPQRGPDCKEDQHQGRSLPVRESCLTSSVQNALLAKRLGAVLHVTHTGTETLPHWGWVQDRQNRYEPGAEGEEKILFESGPFHFLKM